MKKKWIVVFILISILTSCSNTNVVENGQSSNSVEDKLDPIELEKIEAETPLPEGFPVVRGATLVEYFEYYGIYRYRYASDKRSKEIGEELIKELKDIGILASMNSKSLFADSPAIDIVLVDASKQGAIGYITIHTESNSDYSNIPGYTLNASDILFEYLPIELRELEIEGPKDIIIYPDSVLTEYVDEKESFEGTESYTYVKLIDSFSNIVEEESLPPEIQEIYDFYRDFFENERYRYELYPNKIEATRGRRNLRVKFSTFEISGVALGGKIEINIK